MELRCLHRRLIHDCRQNRMTMKITDVSAPTFNLELCVIIINLNINEMGKSKTKYKIK